MGESILLLGGARSGKSSFAEKLAAEDGEKVLYVATAEAGDEEMKERISEHRLSRPSTWRTLEASTRVGSSIRNLFNNEEVVIIDCITLLVTNIILREVENPDTIDIKSAEEAVIAEIEGLIACMDTIKASFIIVSNEVGLGLVPENRLGRLYRDILGRANQRLAEYADKVYLMVAGIPVVIKQTEAI